MKMFYKAQKFTNAALATLTLVAVGGVANGQLPDQNWTGGGDGVSFLDAANWDTGTTVPGVFDDTADPLSNGTTNNFIDGAFTVDRSVESTVNFTSVINGAVLNITDGTLNDSLSNVNRRTNVGTAGDGTVNQSGGMFVVGHALRVGAGGDGANGVYNLTGGTLIASRSSNTLDPAIPGRATAEIGGIDAGSAGLLEISGGTFQTRTGLVLYETGTFSVLGSTADEVGIGSNQSADGFWLQRPGGTISVGFDAGGSTPILVDDVDDDGGGTQGNVTFEAGSMLLLSDIGGADNSVKTIMEWEGTVTGIPDLDPASTPAGWQIMIVGNELQVQNLSLPDPVPSMLG